MTNLLGYKESIDILDWVIAERKRTLGDNHFLVAEQKAQWNTALLNISELQKTCPENHNSIVASYAKALATNQRAAELLGSHLGQHHPKYAVCLYKMALVHQDLDNRSDASALAKDSLALLQAIPGVNHPDTKRAQALLDTLYPL